MPTAVFFVGPPGVGKTTLVRRLLDQPLTLVAAPKWTLGSEVCAAGHYLGGKFDGADTVPYNGVQTALSFWEQRLFDKRFVFFDGDRFSFAGARKFFAERGVEDRCVYLVTDPSLIQARREQRGTTQNATWVKGRVSKAMNFAESFEPSRLLRLDARQAPDELAPRVRAFLGW